MIFPNPVTFVVAMFRWACGYLAGEKPVATSDCQNARLVQCHACEQYASGQCKKCTCYVVVKTWLSSEKCPLGKWDVELSPAGETNNWISKCLPLTIRRWLLRRVKA